MPLWRGGIAIGGGSSGAGGARSAISENEKGQWSGELAAAKQTLYFSAVGRESGERGQSYWYRAYLQYASASLTEYCREDHRVEVVSGPACTCGLCDHYRRTRESRTHSTSTMLDGYRPGDCIQITQYGTFCSSPTAYGVVETKAQGV